jgi:hypothetical protein
MLLDPNICNTWNLKSALKTTVLILLVFVFFLFFGDSDLFCRISHKNRKEFPELQLIIVVLPGKTPVYAEVTFLLSLKYLYFVILSAFPLAGTGLYIGIIVEDPDPHF